MLTPTWEPRQRASYSLMGTNLVIFFVFALAALYFLTRVLVLTAEIDNNIVAAVNPELSGISTNLALLTALDTTGDLTGQMAESLEALPRHLGDAETATNRISESIRNVDRSVASIETSVAGISESVTAIRGSAATLGSGVDDVQGNAQSIDASLAGARIATRSIDANLTSSNDHLGSILDLIPPLTVQTGLVRTRLQSVDVHAENIANNIVIRLGNIGNARMTAGTQRHSLASLSSLLVPHDGAGGAR